MDEKDLQIFLTLAETGNLTRTAEKLYLAQPTLSKRLQNLESELGATLFLRSKHGVTLTPAGEAARETFLHTTKDFEDLRERLREVPVGKPVYVICQSGLRSYIACRILAQQGFKCYNLSGGWRLYETVVRDRTAAQEAWPCGMEK